MWIHSGQILLGKSYSKGGLITRKFYNEVIIL